MDSQTLKPNIRGYIAIRIVRAAFREIQKLSHQYSETVAEILKQMSQGNRGDCRKLKGYTDLRRTKQGDVRVIWERINSQEILVIKAGLRKDVYQGVIEDRYRNPTYTSANLMGIEESQVEDIPTFNFNVNKTSSWYQFIYGAYLYSPHLTQEQIKLFYQLSETLTSYSYSRYSELTNINSFLLQSAPGTGKTVCAAVIASEFYKNHDCNVVLILPESLCSEVKEFTKIKEILQDQQPNFFVGSFAEWLCQSAPELYQLVATSSEELQALQAEAQRVHAISRDELIPYRDLILFRAFVLEKNKVYQSKHPNYHENISRIEYLREKINLSKWKDKLGNTTSWIEGVYTITEIAHPSRSNPFWQTYFLNWTVRLGSNTLIRYFLSTTAYGKNIKNTKNTTLFILDEAQDYLMSEIRTIIKMLERWQVDYNHNSILWLLGDKNQNIRTYALYKLTIMCMNDIWSFQALRMKSR